MDRRKISILILPKKILNKNEGKFVVFASFATKVIERAARDFSFRLFSFILIPQGFPKMLVQEEGIFKFKRLPNLTL